MTAAVLLGLAACVDGNPADPGALPPLEVTVLAGDGQFALPGRTLAPFEIVARDPGSLRPVEDVPVEWSLAEGTGGALDRTSGFTDGAGRARTTLTLGPEPGPFRVRARFPEHDAADVVFEARAVVRPELTGVAAGTVAPDSVVVLEGAHFVPEVERIDVLFSGIRARVLSGDETSLRVRVPPCLVESAIPVVVGLGPVRSASLTVDVATPGTPLGLAPGDVRRIRDPEALSCVLLSGGAGEEYLAVVHSASTVGAALHPHGLVLRAPDEAPATDGGVHAAADGAGIASLRWEGTLRRLEEAALAGGEAVRDAGDEAGVAPAPARVPAVGERRRFDVLDGTGSFTEVVAEVRRVSERAVIYVDVNAPVDGFRDDDLATLAREFDDPIHPTVTDVFGGESDLDGNERVVILFTPVVNRLTERGSDGFIGGFFYGVDLLPDREGSNGGEIFYALVPDPDGEFGDPRSRLQVLTRVPSILAHEFQHMVHFNQRILIRGAERTDALWLSEGLATMAEELVGEAHADRGNADRAELFRSGNRVRAERFLAEPAATSLVVTAGSGSLAERGAGWLFMEYVRGWWGDGVLGELTRTTRTGTRNVEAVAGEPWADLLEPWTAALYLDGLETPIPDRHDFPTLQLREEIGGGSYPLRPPVRGGADATVTGELRSSAGAFSLLTPEGTPGISVNLAGPEGGRLPGASALGLTLVRLR